jgi:hypothetical protein
MPTTATTTGRRPRSGGGRRAPALPPAPEEIRALRQAVVVELCRAVRGPRPSSGRIRR